MSDCPACAAYWPALQRDLDDAGRKHHEAMTRIRELEAAGSLLEPIRDTPTALVRQAAAFDL